MIFVDTNVVMYAVGGEHPLRSEARRFFAGCMTKGTPLVTGAEVLQELVHAYLPVERIEALDAALELVESCVREVWPLEVEDVRLARALADRFSHLGARDLIHLACCKRRNVSEIKTFDRPLGAAFRTGR